jgi:hypothetical protein
MKRVLVFGSVCLIMWACKNEPYELKPYGVTSLINHVSNLTLTFTYHDGRLYTYLAKTSTSDTLGSMKFVYNNGDLVKILLDSTKTSWKVARFSRSDDGTVVTDTITAYDIPTNSEAIYSVRTVVYDGDRYPVSVDVKTWPDGVYTEELAELTWEDGDVIHLVNSSIADGTATVVRDLTIGHDDQYCVYMKEPSFLYTLSLKDLFWLSKNNPLVFNEGDKDKKYKFWYNKLGYPSNYTTDVGTLYGVTYTQVR